MPELEVILDTDNELVEGTADFLLLSGQSQDLPTYFKYVAGLVLNEQADGTYRQIGIFERVGPAERMSAWPSVKTVRVV